jgi:hypothetical protein
MESLKTAFRLVVMLAAIGIGYKAWQLYGPPAEQFKSLALRALDAARSALDSTGQNNGGTTALTADPRPMAPTFDAMPPAPAVTSQVMQAQAVVPTSELPAPTPITPPALAPPPSRLPAPDPLPVAAGENTAAVTVGEDDRLKSLYARLEQLGAHEPQLAAWGSGGQLYRFSCQASLAEIENLNRHFDAVAAGPQAAVEAVVAKVEAWRSAQNETAQLGTTLR